MAFLTQLLNKHTNLKISKHGSDYIFQKDELFLSGCIKVEK